ncbi:MAG: SPFH domain-containing protein [Actinomycetaceae bacterium]|nr:SPFH domain-containing protein [Actinomycetaceae bacterium]
METSLIITVFALFLLFLVIYFLVRMIRIVPQSQTLVVERLGKYLKTLDAGLHLIIPVIDRVRARVDMREQVVPFRPQPVITEDNVVVSIDTVIYYQVTDPRRATYEIADYIVAIEQLTVTTLRNVIGTMDLEQTLTSRDQINGQLRGVLDQATGQWGIRVNRVELKAIDPPPSIQKAMEQQMRAERDKRAAILTAQGVRESEILRAEGEKQAEILQAEGDAKAAVTRAEGEAEAIRQVFQSIHANNADPQLLAYKYVEMLPELANGEGSKVFVIPGELSTALQHITEGFRGNNGLS